VELKTASDPANLAEVRKSIEVFAREAAGFDEASAAEVGLCVNEALANVIRHAYAGRTDRPIRLEAEVSRAGSEAVLRIRVRDWGNGVDPSTQPPEAYDPLQPGGVGLMCIAKLMDRIIYTPQPDGMLLTMTRSADHKAITEQPGQQPCDNARTSRQRSQPERRHE
jgi:serine/threonine-protein kinase RsbW